MGIAWDDPAPKVESRGEQIRMYAAGPWRDRAWDLCLLGQGLGVWCHWCDWMGKRRTLPCLDDVCPWHRDDDQEHFNLYPAIVGGGILKILELRDDEAQALRGIDCRGQFLSVGKRRDGTIAVKLQPAPASFDPAKLPPAFDLKHEMRRIWALDRHLRLWANQQQPSTPAVGMPKRLVIGE